MFQTMSQYPSSSSSSSSSYLMIGIIVIMLIALASVHAVKYLFSIDVSTSLTGLFSSTPTIDIVVDQTKYEPTVVPEIKFRKQVFNIPDNTFMYADASAVCKAYGAELATYDQIEEAYNEGAEWCNYGWSANQLALFPTQKKTYDDLQKVEGHEQDCGRPGINGGFIDNPKVQFGVNCYGYKPRITDEEENLMETATPYPISAKDIAFQKRVDYWKAKISDVLVSPFNYELWSG